VAEEEVTSPDQHRPGVSGRLARFGAIASLLALLSMLIGNHHGNVENIFVIVVAAGIVVMLIGDWILRRNGLR